MPGHDRHIYVLSGLGADHRVFQRIEFPCEHTHIAWIAQLPHEDLASYAKRMAAFIKHERPVLMGLSFGGIVAQEIAKIRPVEQLILISTIKGRNDKPFYFSWIRELRLFHLAPERYFDRPTLLTYWAFSMLESSNRFVLDQCFENTNSEHILWAIDHILEWEGVDHQTPYIHIHSKRDRIFPLRSINECTVIDGGHFAVFTHFHQVNSILATL